MSRRNHIGAPHDVYRVYGEEGALLYVGISINAFSRIPQHRSEYQPWWPSAHHFSVTRYADGTTARYFEALAIRDERPIGNRKDEKFALTRASRIHADPVEPTEYFYVDSLKGR